MRSTSRTALALLVAVAMSTAGSVALASPGGGQWPNAGGGLSNTRNQTSGSKLTPASVGGLQVKWSFTTGGDVSATPSVDGSTVYFPDWAGNLYAVDKSTGAQRWKASIPQATGIAGDKARNTPVIAGNKVIVGTQGDVGQNPDNGARLLAFDKNSGNLLWRTKLDPFFASIVTESATVHGNTVYVGTASLEEALAAFIPGYDCCQFRGSMYALDLDTGAIKWQTRMVPSGFSGGAIWGSSPAVDTKRGQVYLATGNNYSVPPAVLDCVAAAGSDPAAQQACIPADDLFDSVVALDMQTGAVRWATKALPYDAWTVDCIPFLGDGDNCPTPAGPDDDFGQAPSLFSTAKSRGGKSRELVGAGQKSGQTGRLTRTPVPLCG